MFFFCTHARVFGGREVHGAVSHMKVYPCLPFLQGMWYLAPPLLHCADFCGFTLKKCPLLLQRNFKIASWFAGDPCFFSLIFLLCASSFARSSTYSWSFVFFFPAKTASADCSSKPVQQPRVQHEGPDCSPAQPQGATEISKAKIDKHCLKVFCFHLLLFPGLRMYDYSLAQPVHDYEQIRKLGRSFCFGCLNCINIAYIHYILQVGIEVSAYTCVYQCYDSLCWWSINLGSGPDHDS